MDAEASAKIAELTQRLLDSEQKREAMDELLHQKEEQLARAERLVEAGRSAAEIAHRMSDVLMGVAGCSRVALDRLGPSSPASRLLEEITKATEEGALVAARIALLDEGTGDAPLARDAGVSPSRAPASVGGAPRPSRPRGGGTVLLVAAERIVRVALRAALEQGGYRVIDAGSAVEALRVARAFPGPIRALVTDARMSGESGLALAADVLAERADTRVVCMARAGEAATVAGAGAFVVLEKPFAPDALLAALGATRPGPPRPSADEPTGPPKGARVLLVEDEDTTRIALARLLGYRGHVVHAVKTVDEALVIAHEGGALDVLLTDLVLPSSEFNGDVLAHRVLEILPTIRVIAVSGFPRDVVRDRYDLPEGAEFMEKPLELELLERRLEGLRRSGP
jgi:CheY-like chemotaxis protein